MKNKIKKITYLILLAIMLCGFSQNVFAQTSNIQFEQTPLFRNVNFIPGDSVSRWVKLNNATLEPHRVILRVLNISNPDGLGDVIDLVIKQGSTILYDNTFSDLFNKGNLVLSQVPAGAEVQFDFIATFKTNAEDKYQGKTMGFNLQIGFEDLDVIEDDTTTSFGGSSSGGGIGGGPITIGQKHLIISNEQIANVTPPQLNTVSVSWSTNMPATSQVIYGLASGGPYVLNLSATNFGYSMSTVEDMTKVESHSVILSGLLPGETYSFRAVSRASPPTVGFEYTFKVNEDGTVGSPALVAIGNNGGGSNFPPQENGEVLGVSTFRAGGDALSFNTDENNSSPDESGITNNSNQSATVFSISKVFSWETWTWRFLLLIILIILFVIWRSRRQQDI